MYRPYNARPVPRPQQSRPSRGRWLLVPPIIVVLVLLYVIYALLRPLGEPKTTILPPVIPGQVSVKIPWPADSGTQAAFGAVGYGLLATHNAQTPVPTASVAKVITALAVLQKKPLKPGEQGPGLTMTATDVARYNDYVAKDGSVVPVYQGETISEYQALQAMMLPSANNIADTAAIWAFGSLEAYRAYATNMIKTFGMNSTTIGTDASGYDPSTVSTAHDLVLLGEQALRNPVLSEIVAQPTAVFPGYGTMHNVNNLLGTAGIRGIKTGNTDEAGGCYLVAADVPVGGKKVTVITAIMAAKNRPTAMQDSLPIVQAAVSEFRNVAVVNSGDSVGTVTTPWGSRTDLIADKDISVLVYNGTALSPTVHAQSVPVPSRAGTSAGTVELTYDGATYTSSIHTATPLSGPSAGWRLTHPF